MRIYSGVKQAFIRMGAPTTIIISYHAVFETISVPARSAGYFHELPRGLTAVALKTAYSVAVLHVNCVN